MGGGAATVDDVLLGNLDFRSMQIRAKNHAGLVRKVVIHPAGLAIEKFNVEVAHSTFVVPDFGIGAVDEENLVSFTLQFHGVVVFVHYVPVALVSDLENLDGG